jgi:hypothetical protein
MLDERKRTPEGKLISKYTLHFETLRAQAPELFLDNYPRTVQRYRMPCIVDRKDVMKWRERTFKDKEGVERKLHPMPFPPIPDPLTADPNHKDVKYWFGVTEEAVERQLYFPVLKPNRSANAHLFPYIPACGKTDTLNTMDHPLSKYQRWLNDPSLRFEQHTGEKKKKVKLLTRRERYLQDTQLRYIRIPADSQRKKVRGHPLKLVPLDDLKIILKTAREQGYLFEKEPCSRRCYIEEITTARGQGFLEGLIKP